MKFVVRKQCWSHSRLGLLMFEGLNGENSNQKTIGEYSTPLCLQYTINGSVPHIVSDLLTELNDDNSPLLIPLPTTYLMNESLRQFNTAFKGVKSGIVDFAGIQKGRPSIISIQDPLIAIKSGNNCKEGSGVYCRGGKHTINSSKLIDVVTNFRPDAYQAVCDSDTPSDASNKRIHNSVERSLYLLEECIEKHKQSEQLKSENIAILATIEGGLNARSRTKSAEESAAKSIVNGFIIDGFHSYGPQVSTQLDLVSIQPILREIIDILPKDKPKIMFGAMSPTLIVKLIECGIDVFDSSYASVMTDNGMALQELIDLKAMKINDNSLDLNSKLFKEDFGLIDPNCQCYTCANGFSRAYINHLLNASEMLAKVLLMFHNLHTFYHFFRDIRQLLDDDSIHQLLR